VQVCEALAGRATGARRFAALGGAYAVIGREERQAACPRPGRGEPSGTVPKRSLIQGL